MSCEASYDLVPLTDVKGVIPVLGSTGYSRNSVMPYRRCSWDLQEGENH